jgi:hypothetical protein
MEQDCLELVCEIQTNKQIPKIVWSKNNKTLPLDGRIAASTYSDVCSLKIQKPTSEDSGTYMCTVDIGGKTEGISQIVRFRENKTEILGVPKKRKPSVKLTEKEELSEIANSLVTPKKSKAMAAGAERKKPSLKPTNSIDEEPKPMAKPSSFGTKPVFSTPLSDRTSTEDTSVKLMCTLMSGSDSEIEWFKNNKPITNGSKYHISLVEGLAILEIVSTTASDTGEYTCIAKNRNGETTTSAKLKIYGDYHPVPVPPVFTRQVKGRRFMIQLIPFLGTLKG